MKNFIFLMLILAGCEKISKPDPGSWSLYQCNYVKCNLDVTFPTKDGCEAAASAGNKASDRAAANSQFSCSENK